MVVLLATGFLPVAQNACAASQVTLEKVGALSSVLAVAWSESNDYLFQRYEVYVKLASDASYNPTPAATITDIHDNVWADVGYTNALGDYYDFQPSTAYTVKVRDVDSLGWADSNGLTVTTTAAPALTNTTISPSSATLSWTNPFDYGTAQDSTAAFVNYEIYRATSLAGPFSILNTITNPTARSWIDSTLTPGTTYYYYVNITSIFTETNPSSAATVAIGTNTMTVQTPKITLSSPNGGETWEAGKTYPITWNSVGSTGNVKIEFVKGANAPETIVGSTANAGSYSWTIPKTQSPGTDYKVKITSVLNSAVTDDSAAIFTITAPSVTVISPNGGGSWILGNEQTISWHALSTITNVKIDLFKDGSLVMTIVSSTPNNGNYTWKVPSSLAAASGYSVKVSDASDPSKSDSSDGTFILAAVPNGPSPGGPGGISSTVMIALAIAAAAIIVIALAIVMTRRKKTSQPPAQPPKAT